jgi:hypothetical protein
MPLWASWNRPKFGSSGAPNRAPRRRTGVGGSGQRASKCDRDVQPPAFPSRCEALLYRRSIALGGDRKSDVTTTTSTYPLRRPISIKAEAEKLAAAEGTSLNRFVATAVAEKAAALRTASYFAERRARRLGGVRPAHGPPRQRPAPPRRRNAIEITRHDSVAGGLWRAPTWLRLGPSINRRKHRPFSAFLPRPETCAVRAPVSWPGERARERGLARQPRLAVVGAPKS